MLGLDLHNACLDGDVDKVKSLCEKAGANTEATNSEGQTPLHLAALMGKVKVVMYLCEEADANKEATDADGQTPLHLAALHGQLDVVRYIYKNAGVNKEATNNAGQTPLDLVSTLASSPSGRLRIPKPGNHANYLITKCLTGAYPTGAPEFPLLSVAAVALVLGIGAFVYMKRK